MNRKLEVRFLHVFYTTDSGNHQTSLGVVDDIVLSNSLDGQIGYKGKLLHWKLKTQLGVHPSSIQTTAPVGFLEAKPIQENPGHHSLSSRAILWGRTLHLGWRKRFGSSTDFAIVGFLLPTT